MPAAASTAIVLAHPGHEFRLLEWIRRERPVVHILTQGSRNGRSTERIEASGRLLAEVGATCGTVFGVARDREFYEAVMTTNLSFFDALLDQLTADFIARNVKTVVADSWQNYNPIHDLAHLAARSSAGMAAEILDRRIAFLDYPVVDGHLTGAPKGPETSRLTLSPSALSFKVAKLSSYPDIADDALALTRQLGDAALSVETLHRPLPLSQLEPREQPLYEIYGAKRVRAGHYQQVLSWAHVSAIASHMLQRAPFRTRLEPA